MPRRGRASGPPLRRSKNQERGRRARPSPASPLDDAAETPLDEDVAPEAPPALFVGRPLEWSEARALANHLAVLADASRLRLLSRIASEVDGQASVGDLARFLELRQPTATHHLQALHRAGFVARIPDQRRVYYRLEAGALALVGEVLRPPEAPSKPDTQTASAEVPPASGSPTDADADADPAAATGSASELSPAAASPPSSGRS